MQFEIRKARSQDEDEVYGLVRNFAVSFQPDRITFSNSFEKLILEESAHVLVAVSQKQLWATCLDLLILLSLQTEALDG